MGGDIAFLTGSRLDVEPARRSVSIGRTHKVPSSLPPTGGADWAGASGLFVPRIPTKCRATIRAHDPSTQRPRSGEALSFPTLDRRREHRGGRVWPLARESD